jgi:hypothetical protein
MGPITDPCGGQCNGKRRHHQARPRRHHKTGPETHVCRRKTLNRNEQIAVLADLINDSVFKASALRSVLTDLIVLVRLPDDEKVYQMMQVAEGIMTGNT